MPLLPSFDEAPSVPTTPSATINSMLERYSKKHTNVVKGAITYYIFGFFHVVTTFYNVLNPDSKNHSHRLWIGASVVMSCLIMLKAYLIYSIIMASAFVMATLLYYSALGFALFGVGLGVSGAMFFDKDGHKKTETKRPPVPSNPPPTKKFPADAKIVPEAVRNIEQPTTPTPEAVKPVAPSAPAPATPSSGTHGTPTESSPEEKKTA